jgi:hypothetical protein
MRTRLVGAVGLALLLALAGCSAFGGSPADEGGDEFESFEFPDGTSPDGITNATAVLTTHQNQLAEDSYRLSFNLRYARGTEAGNSSTVVASNVSQGRQILIADLPGREVTNFATPGNMSSRIVLGNDTSYQHQELGFSMADMHRQGAAPGPMLQTIVSSGNYTANRTGTIGDHSVVWFNTSSARANATGQVPGEIEQYNASLAIDEEGRIWNGGLVASGQTNGTGVAFRQEYQTDRVGDVTVQRPSWVDNATG